MRAISGTRPSSRSQAVIQPSFRITSGSPARGGSGLRLDQVNSGDLIRSARRIYADFVVATLAMAKPTGVVLLADRRQGRVVFEQPVLLPDELFIPMDLLRPRR